MAIEISGVGTRVILFASNTFPNGIILSQFADNADPVDIPSVQVADKGATLNGELVTWKKAQPIPLTLNVMPNSEDDQNLSEILSANRVSVNKFLAYDVIQLNITYPSGQSVTYSNGVITDGPPGIGIASEGRLKTNEYKFAFEDRTISI